MGRWVNPIRQDYEIYSKTSADCCYQQGELSTPIMNNLTNKEKPTSAPYALAVNSFYAINNTLRPRLV
jgi:hypothetical protein